MPQKIDDRPGDRLAIAALAAAFAQTIAEHDETFKERLTVNIDRLYGKIRNFESESEPLGAMEMLTWLRDFLNK